MNQILSQVDNHHVVSGATGCLEVSSTRYPYTAWKGSYIHTNFENAAATLSGVETAFRALRRRGKLEERVKFIAFGGDGGTYDIGLQALSGAMERGHDMLYVCYDNGAYMNTGFQRSSATPHGAWTTTSPVGSELPGKIGHSKNLTEIMVAHRLPYVAQSSPHDPQDLIHKAEKALAIEGPTFLNVLSACPRGWRTENDEGIELSRLATEVCYWPLFEVNEGVYRLTYRPRHKQPLGKWLERQGRFAHLALPGNEHLLEQLQEWVDFEWDLLLRKCDEIPEDQWDTASQPPQGGAVRDAPELRPPRVAGRTAHREHDLHGARLGRLRLGPARRRVRRRVRGLRAGRRHEARRPVDEGHGPFPPGRGILSHRTREPGRRPRGGPAPHRGR